MVYDSGVYADGLVSFSICSKVLQRIRQWFTTFVGAINCKIGELKRFVLRTCKVIGVGARNDIFAISSCKLAMDLADILVLTCIVLLFYYSKPSGNWDVIKRECVGSKFLSRQVESFRIWVAPEFCRMYGLFHLVFSCCGMVVNCSQAFSNLLWNFKNGFRHYCTGDGGDHWSRRLFLGQ